MAIVTDTNGPSGTSATDAIQSMTVCTSIRPMRLPRTSTVPDAPGSALSSGCAPKLASVFTHELTQRSSDVSHWSCASRRSATPDIRSSPLTTSCCRSVIHAA
ncbi:MAG TPA: hypothetical protein VGF51_14835 [Acidimicrobiales bacterium]